MKIWISKYALSRGITEHDCGPSRNDGYVCLGYDSLKLGRDAHMAREEAVKAAEVTRIKKIASLRKQLAKLEEMRF